MKALVFARAGLPVGAGAAPPGRSAPYGSDFSGPAVGIHMDYRF